MGLFKLKKNKRYSYSGRYSEDNSYLGKHSVPKKLNQSLMSIELLWEMIIVLEKNLEMQLMIIKKGLKSLLK